MTARWGLLFVAALCGDVHGVSITSNDQAQIDVYVNDVYVAPPGWVLAHEAALMEAASQNTGLMRREVEASAASLAAVAGAATSDWNPTIVTSSNTIDLNGAWVSSASKEARVIADAVATGPGSFKVNLYIKEGGRRVEFAHAGRNYWATMSGRGTLNWNDGSTWTRKVDCKWSDFTDFGACGGPCAANEQQRQREYEYLQENGGAPCIGPLLRCQESSYCGGQDQAQEEQMGQKAVKLGHRHDSRGAVTIVPTMPTRGGVKPLHR